MRRYEKSLAWEVLWSRIFGVAIIIIFPEPVRAGWEIWNLGNMGVDQEKVRELVS